MAKVVVVEGGRIRCAWRFTAGAVPRPLTKAWAALTAVPQFDAMLVNGLVLVATTGGTTGATSASAPTQAGPNQTDGSVVWAACSMSGLALALMVVNTDAGVAFLGDSTVQLVPIEGGFGQVTNLAPTPLSVYASAPAPTSLTVVLSS